MFRPKFEFQDCVPILNPGNESEEPLSSVPDCVTKKNLIALRNCETFQLDDVEIDAFSVASGTIGDEFNLFVVLVNSDARIGAVSDEKEPGDCCALKLDLKDEKEILPEV